VGKAAEALDASIQGHSFAAYDIVGHMGTALWAVATLRLSAPT